MIMYRMPRQLDDISARLIKYNRYAVGLGAYTHLRTQLKLNVEMGYVDAKIL
jgi:hypothetical protein